MEVNVNTTKTVVDENMSFLIIANHIKNTGMTKAYSPHLISIICIITVLDNQNGMTVNKRT